MSTYTPRDLAWRIETTAGDVWMWIDPTSGDRATVETEGLFTTTRPIYLDDGSDELLCAAAATRTILNHLPTPARLIALHAPRGDR